MGLYEELKAYAASDTLPFHMPGHKRKRELGGDLPYELDITEIEGFDNLHCPSGILKDLSERMAAVWKSGTAFPLVGGSTCGILAALYAMTCPGDSVILARGCHRSVYHALEIGRLKPIYLSSPVNPTYGFFDSVSPQEVEKTMEEHPEGKWVVLTSPTYEGVISDIQSIAEIVHKRGGLLLVDQAHGAHLGLSPAFPADALSCGADVVVSSLHKTLPALTQTAALHLRVGLDPIPFEHALSVFETSSPSYLLLASIDRCVTLLEQKREELFESYRQALCRFDREVAGLQKVQIPGHNAPLSEGIFDWDPGKLTVCTPDAQVVCEKLRRAFWIEPEMVTPDWVLCMTSIADGEKELHRLAHALFQIEHQLSTQEVRHFETPPLPIQRLSPSEAMRGENQLVPWDQAVGRVAGEYVQAYPPGIPLVVPGEQITEDLCRQITYQREHLTCLEHSISQVSGQILVKAENQH